MPLGSKKANPNASQKRFFVVVISCNRSLCALFSPGFFVDRISVACSFLTLWPAFELDLFLT